MDVWEWSALLVLALLSAAQFVTVVVFGRLFARLSAGRADETPPDRWPRVSLLMGMKGRDPDLCEHLCSLFTQDYPEYEVRIVVEDESDPAWAAVIEAIERTGASFVHLEAYRPSAETGSVSSTNAKLMQSILQLDERTEVIAMADADLHASTHWLKDLVGPLLQDERLGATFGNRWFIPAAGQWGSLVRYLWNLAAVPPMGLWGIPWGGCFAIRAEIVRKQGLFDQWKRVIAFDAATPRELKRLGWKPIRFVPGLMMVNREECSVPFSLNFIRRQLTWTRLYHGDWPFVVGQTLMLTGGACWACGLWLCACGRQDATAAGWLGGGLIAYWLSLFGMSLLLELLVRRSLRYQGQPERWLSPVKLLKLFLAIPLTQVIQTVATAQASLARKVTWRGTVLEIHGPYDIRMLENRPIEATADDRSSL